MTGYFLILHTISVQLAKYKYKYIHIKQSRSFYVLPCWQLNIVICVIFVVFIDG